MEKVVPRRFDEGWGTWHAKIYAVDEEVVITGQVHSLSARVDDDKCFF